MEGHTFSSRQVGDYQVTALFDGAMAVGFELLAGIDAAAAGKIQSSHGVTPPATIDISGYLIRGHGRVMLVDAGTAAGITPGEDYRLPCARPASRLRISTPCS